MSKPKIDYQLALLEFLNEVGITQQRNISDFIKSNFDKPTVRISNSDDIAVRFLQELLGRGYIAYNIGALSHINEWSKSTEPEPVELRLWFDDIEVYGNITFGGLEYLTQQTLNKSIIESNRTISKNSNLQTIAIGLTVLFALLSFVVSGLNYISEKSKEPLKIQLSQQSQQIHTLQIQLSQVTNELLLEKEAKKTSPKKNEDN